MAVNPQQQRQQALQQAQQQAPQQAQEQRNWSQYLRGQINNIRQSISGSLTEPIQPRINYTTGIQQAKSFSPFGYGAVGTTGLLSTNGTMQNGIGRILAYIIGIIIVALIISLLVHYYITPIYSLQPGAPGIIPVPGFDDGIIFWNGSGKYPAMGVIKNDDLPIKSVYCDYTLIVDMFIQNPLQFSQKSRILLRRGNSSTDIKSNNLIVALQPDTTDMIIYLINTNNTTEQLLIENIPIQEPFRLGIVVMQNALEVYINGFLMKTRQIKNALKDIDGDISPASGSEISIAKMQNLKIWPRILSTSEIRQAKPELADAKSFKALPIPSSTSCAN